MQKECLSNSFGCDYAKEMSRTAEGFDIGMTLAYSEYYQNGFENP